MFVRLTRKQPLETIGVNLALVSVVPGRHNHEMAIRTADGETIEITETFEDMMRALRYYNRIVIGMDELPSFYDGEVKR